MLPGDERVNDAEKGRGSLLKEGEFVAKGTQDIYLNAAPHLLRSDEKGESLWVKPAGFDSQGGEEVRIHVGEKNELTISGGANAVFKVMDDQERKAVRLGADQGGLNLKKHYLPATTAPVRVVIETGGEENDKFAWFDVQVLQGKHVDQSGKTVLPNVKVSYKRRGNIVDWNN